MTRYRVYIISKGRPKCITAKALDLMMVDYEIVIEPQDLESYMDHHDRKKIRILPFRDLGQGSIPARNWVWEDSIKRGFSRHWILDDNIEQFNRMNNNLQIKVHCPAPFQAAEDFVDRYKNVGLAGFEYDFFCKSRCKWPPFRLNTRIYSCILIRNDLPFRWRGRFNEDTDLSLRVLKSGECTVLFLAFLQQKTQTMKMQGGNTEMYEETDSRREFAESLVQQHPDVAKVTRKFGRWHHHVNYKPFKKNNLEFIDSIELSDSNNEYGMSLCDSNNKKNHKSLK